MAPPWPRGAGEPSGRGYAWRSASIYAKRLPPRSVKRAGGLPRPSATRGGGLPRQSATREGGSVPKRGGTGTSQRADEQGICHAIPPKNICFDAELQRAASPRFTACPLFRNTCDSFDRLDERRRDAGRRERTRYNRRRGRARGRHRGGVMSPDEAVALSFALFSDVPRPGLTDRLRADDPHLLERARALLPQAAAVRAAAASRGIRTVAWNEPAFPAALLTLDDLPPALWFRGELDALTAPAVAIVGSRAASAVAIETATRIANDLASRGITVVSGLARGVDSAAHRGALETGRTAAVLGSGLDRMYPAQHEPLAAQIARDGIVISEYPPATPPLPLFFPMRNRLISGLSRAVVVIEANEKSGSLITAACALEQGREGMAVAGHVLRGRNRGAHALIRDGAKIVECADDIVEELLSPAHGIEVRETGLSSASSVVSADPIVARMELGQAYDVDGLATLSGLENVRLLSRLIDLELQGRVRRVGGGRFMRCG